MDQDITDDPKITESNSHGLLIKPKMAKTESFFEQGNRKQPENLPAPPPPKVCHICKKGFESGKALGGHMRMHAQESKGLIKSSSIKSYAKPVAKSTGPTEVDTVSTNDSADKPICAECGKVFPSKKSLYGHMRSHPDRPYRGIEPPQSAKNSPTSTLSDALPHKLAAEDQQIDSVGTARVWFGPNPKAKRGPDLAKVVPVSWSQTAKRGRKSCSLSDYSDDDDDESGHNDEDDDSDDDEELDEAVHDLMMLAQAIPKGAEEATNSNFMTRNHGHDVKEDRKIIDEKSRNPKLDIEEEEKELELGLALKEVNEEAEEEDEEFSDSENSESIVLANMMMRKKRRKMRLEDLEGVMVAAAHDHHQHQHQHQSQQHRVYSCSLCNKSFQSHQALGGHMSSHKKLKNNNNNNTTSLTEHDPHLPHRQSGSEDTNNNNNIATQVERDQAENHQCKTCNRTFHTGQALGGHMRSHWTGPIDQAQSSQTGRKVLDFDLNELPPMEYEQGTDYFGAGYAASSYNSVT